MDKQVIVSPSPHVHSGESTSRLMFNVVLALMPAFAVSLYYFGVGAFIVTLLAVGSCVIFEYLIQKFLLKGNPTITDGSAIVTGLLLAFNVPSNLPWHIVVIGSLVAIGVAKM
nr:RnfABCDGE type electron transport complex subunit D [Tenuifilaceae bacterium]